MKKNPAKQDSSALSEAFCPSNLFYVKGTGKYLLKISGNIHACRCDDKNKMRYLLEAAADGIAGTGGKIDNTLGNIDINAFHIQHDSAVCQQGLRNLSGILHRSGLNHTYLHPGTGSGARS